MINYKLIKEKLLEEKKAIILRLKSDLNIDLHGDETDFIQGISIIDVENQICTRDIHKLNKINEALSKIDCGLYGICTVCEEQINPRRLLFNPYFTMCIECAEELELSLKHNN